MRFDIFKYPPAHTGIVLYCIGGFSHGKVKGLRISRPYGVKISRTRAFTAMVLKCDALLPISSLLLSHAGLILVSSIQQRVFRDTLCFSLLHSLFLLALLVALGSLGSSSHLITSPESVGRTRQPSHVRSPEVTGQAGEGYTPLRGGSHCPR